MIAFFSCVFSIYCCFTVILKIDSQLQWQQRFVRVNRLVDLTIWLFLIFLRLATIVLQYSWYRLGIFLAVRNLVLRAEYASTGSLSERHLLLACLNTEVAASCRMRKRNVLIVRVGRFKFTVLGFQQTSQSVAFREILDNLHSVPRDFRIVHIEHQQTWT